MLSTLVWLPFLGALMLGFWPGSVAASRLRLGAIAVSALLLLINGGVLTQFDLGVPGLQMQEYFPWVDTLGLSYGLGVDGLSLPLVTLTNVITLAVVFGADTGLRRQSFTLSNPRLFYALVFLINGGIVGGLLAQNLLLFFLFYELELIPFYLLILVWGGKKREYAAMKFLIYTAVSGILILVGFLAITWLSGSTTFDYAALHPEALPLRTKLIVLTILLIGFSVKIPLVPLHSWLPDAYVEASAPVAILLGGALSKLGTYGLVRFCMGLFPDTWAIVAPGLSIVAAGSVLYGALAAIAQKDLKRMVAYSSIGHMGYVLLGTAAHTQLSLVGTVAQMISHGLILALLFYLVGVIEAKIGTRDLDVLNGLLNPIRGLPLTSALLVLAAMASAGIPGLMGFISEFLIFQGSYATFPLQTLLSVVGSGLTAVYFVILLNRTCFGKLDNTTAYYPTVTLFEQAPAIVLTALIFWFGVQPTWLVRWSEATTTGMVATIPSIVQQQVALNSLSSRQFPLITP